MAEKTTTPVADGREREPVAAPASPAAAIAEPAKPAAAIAEPVKPVAAEAAAPEPTIAAPAAVAAAEPPAKTGKDFLAAFGQQGAVWFVEGKSWDEAHALHSASLQKQIDDLSQKLAAVNFGQPSPVSAGDADVDTGKPSPKQALAAHGNVSRIMAGIRMPRPSSN